MREKPLTKPEIIDALAGETGLTKKDAGSFLTALAELVYAQGDRGFILPGLCKFTVSRRKESCRFNVATRRHYVIAEHDVLKVIPLKRARMRMAPPPENLVLEEVPPKQMPANLEEAPPEPARSVTPPPPPPAPEPAELGDEAGGVVFDCPHCGESIMALASDRGESGYCPQCGGDIVVPGEGDGTEAVQDDPKHATSQFVTFVCESCGQEIEAPLEAIGLKGECPSCGSFLQIPEEKEPEPSSGIEEITSESGKKLDAGSMTIRMDLSDFLSNM